MGTTRVPAERAGRVINAEIVRRLSAMIADSMGELTDRAEQEVRPRTPVDTGRLMGGWKRIPGRPKRGGVVNEEPHAKVIDMGRRLGRNSRGGGARMLGSPHAPAGITGPAARAIPVEDILQRAVRRND